jgi:hypothetical protein
MHFAVAGPDYEPELRKLTRSLSMPGWVRIAFEREPNYFHGLGIQGQTNQAIVATDGERLIGMGCRSIRSMYVDGKGMEFGYLSGLRSLPEGREAGTLARGYQFLRELHGDRRVPAYISTIVEDNAEAIGLLTSGRAGLPRYLDYGRYVTFAIHMTGFRRHADLPGLEIHSGGEIALGEIARFLNEEGRTRQFFPVVSVADFGTDLFRAFSPQDFLVATRGSKVVGTLAAWDQSSFKQVRVCGYRPGLSFLRPFLNVALRLASHTTMPAPGEMLKILQGAFGCVQEDDPAVLRALLGRLCRERADAGYHFFTLGFHERDPLRTAPTGLPAFRYASRMYLVCWEDGLDFCRSLGSGRIPHLEVAML